MTVVFQPHHRAEIKVVEFDYFLSNNSIHLKGQQELANFKRCIDVNQGRTNYNLLILSKRLRSYLTELLSSEEYIQHPQYDIWVKNIRTVLSCWRVLEIQLLETFPLVLYAVVSDK